MYLKLNNGIIEKFPYTIGELRSDNSHISFPREIPESTLAEYGVFPVEVTQYPEVGFDKNVAEGQPELVNGVWKQVWVVSDIGADGIAYFNAQQKRCRETAYATESDPIFFMSQRGEATQEEWLAKIAEIKARFPYQAE